MTTADARALGRGVRRSAWAGVEYATSHPRVLASVTVGGFALAVWSRHALTELGRVSVP